jgi:hypothetical protein
VPQLRHGWWGMGIVGGHVFEVARLARDLSGCSQISVVMMVTLQGYSHSSWLITVVGHVYVHLNGSTCVNSITVCRVWMVTVPCDTVPIILSLSLIT